MNLSEPVWLYEESWNVSRAEEEDQKLLFGIGTDNFITLLVFGLIFTLGVLGNSMVITVLARSKPGKPRSTTNIFILNLSIADLSYLLFCIPFQSTIYMMPTWVLGAFICKFIHYFFTVSMLVSIFTLSAMSVDRYIAIVHSRKSSSIRVAKHALIGVVVIWILSLAMAAPVMYYQNIFHRGENHTFCWEVWPDQNQKKVYVVCTFVFGYVLPLLLITFCYAKVLNHLHKKLRNVSKKSEASKKKVRIGSRCQLQETTCHLLFVYIAAEQNDLLMQQGLSVDVLHSFFTSRFSFLPLLNVYRPKDKASIQTYTLCLPNM
uniref:G-protein coupled receptors family 1 profile domain-containing protein n=1 Tax=Dicentrarchus labrax TaxID=13489 RepID=A0A8C4DK49_DICLA